MKKKSIVSAMVGGKCPRCRQGDLFPVPLSSFRKLTLVNHHCEHCGAVFAPEPDFFYGAMYVSYAFSVALVINVFFILNFLMERPPLWAYMVTIVIGNIVLLPLMLRYSKVLYLYGVGKLKYDPKASAKK